MVDKKSRTQPLQSRKMSSSSTATLPRGNAIVCAFRQFYCLLLNFSTGRMTQRLFVQQSLLRTRMSPTPNSKAVMMRNFWRHYRYSISEEKLSGYGRSNRWSLSALYRTSGSNCLGTSNWVTERSNRLDISASHNFGVCSEDRKRKFIDLLCVQIHIAGPRRPHVIFYMRDWLCAAAAIDMFRSHSHQTPQMHTFVAYQPS